MWAQPPKPPRNSDLYSPEKGIFSVRGENHASQDQNLLLTKMATHLGAGVKHCYFHLETWGNNPISPTYFASGSRTNHRLDILIFCRNSRGLVPQEVGDVLNIASLGRVLCQVTTLLDVAARLKATQLC